MRNLLPIPSAEHIPPYVNAKPFTDMLDKQFTQWFDETVAIDFLKTVARIPYQFLDMIGEMLAADIHPIDSERTKRIKILLSNDMNKRRGMWITVKELLDGVTGGDARIINSLVVVSPNTELMSVEGEGIEYPDPFYFVLNSIQGDYNYAVGMMMSGDDVIMDSGMLAMNDKGMIFIDLRTAVELNEQQVEQAKAAISMQVPAYYRVKLGYIGTDFNFVPYSNGTIH